MDASSVIHITIGGKRYKLVYARLRKDDGVCDHPSQPGKTITIDPRVRQCDRRYMETVLHEMLHAACWALDEECVADYARDAARVLFRLGFRCSQDQGSEKQGE